MISIPLNLKNEIENGYYSRIFREKINFHFYIKNKIISGNKYSKISPEFCS